MPGELLRETQRERLRPLKLRAADLDLRFALRVGPTGLVTWRTNRHSMPAEALGFAATLRAYRDRVVIEAGRYRAGHPRLHGRDGISSLPAHRAGLLAAVSGRRGRMYLKRRQLLDLGPDAERVITELVHVRRRRWPDDIKRAARWPPVSVSAIARDEVAHRRQTRLQRCVRKAGFPELKTVEDFDFSVQPAVLVVDEVGYLSVGHDAANLLFHVVNDRHVRRRSMLFTTNKPLKDWGAALHDPDLAEAILDRVLERGRIIPLEGPSMRTRHLGGLDYER